MGRAQQGDIYALEVLGRRVMNLDFRGRRRKGGAEGLRGDTRAAKPRIRFSDGNPSSSLPEASLFV
jgi:hypothetical protein